MRDLRGLVLLCAVLLGLYLPTLWQGFHFDDYHMVTHNLLIKEGRFLLRTVLTPDISSVPVSKGMYRPVLMATYAWNYQHGRMNPVGYHLTNVWLHLLTACCAVGLVFGLWPQVATRWVLWGVLLWAVHPLHTESVAYIASRSSSLATMWVVLTAWFFVSVLSSSGWRRRFLWIGSWAAFVLALGSKEIAITVPGLLLLCQWRLAQLAAGPSASVRAELVEARMEVSSARSSFDRPVLNRPFSFDKLRMNGRAEGLRANGYRICLRLLPFLLLTGLYLLWRKLLIGAVGVVHPIRPWGINFRMQLEGFLRYVQLWFWPANQSLIHPNPSGIGWGPWVGFILWVALIALAWVSRKKYPGFTFVLGWVGITFAPIAMASSLNLVVAEHHWYLPSVGFAIGAPALLEKFSASGRGNRRLFVTGVCLFLAGVLAVATVQRVRVWRDDFTLWSDAVAHAPSDSRAHSNLGLEYEARGEVEEALHCYLRALSLANDKITESTARNNLGNLFGFVGQPQAALTQFQRCLEVNPYERGYYENNIGLAYSDLGEQEKAERFFTMALDADPQLIQAYLNLGSLRFRHHQLEPAGRLFEQAVRRDPDHLQAHWVLGKFYMSRGQFTQAAEIFQRFVKLSPHQPEGYVYLGLSLLQGNPPQQEKADRCLARAVALGWEPRKGPKTDLYDAHFTPKEVPSP